MLLFFRGFFSGMPHNKGKYVYKLGKNNILRIEEGGEIGLNITTYFAKRKHWSDETQKIIYL